MQAFHQIFTQLLAVIPGNTRKQNKTKQNKTKQSKTKG